MKEKLERLRLSLLSLTWAVEDIEESLRRGAVVGTAYVNLGWAETWILMAERTK